MGWSGSYRKSVLTLTFSTVLNLFKFFQVWNLTVISEDSQNVYHMDLFGIIHRLNLTICTKIKEICQFSRKNEGISRKPVSNQGIFIGNYLFFSNCQIAFSDFFGGLRVKLGLPTQPKNINGRKKKL